MPKTTDVGKLVELGSKTTFCESFKGVLGEGDLVFKFVLRKSGILSFSKDKAFQRPGPRMDPYSRRDFYPPWPSRVS